jgi:aspartate/methionine/tyrosine aminotransferase
VPLVNNADGQVLTRSRARDIASAVLEHNARHPHQPVYVLADDVYVGSYLNPDRIGTPIASVTGTDLCAPTLGRMSDWTLTVVTPSKTFALPTARVAFTATTSPRLRGAVEHYRTVFSQGRVPQATELTATAALCLTSQAWIDGWNATYRSRLGRLTERITAINAEAGFEAFEVVPPEGGWYLPLRISPRLIPKAASGVDAFAVLLHYGDVDPDSGIGMLPGELFGHMAPSGGSCSVARCPAVSPTFTA